MSDEEVVERILCGKERVWRFTEREQVGSTNAADRLLWLGILRAERELAEAVFGGLRTGTGKTSLGAATPCRFLESISQPLPDSFDALIAELGIFPICSQDETQSSTRIRVTLGSLTRESRSTIRKVQQRPCRNMESAERISRAILRNVMRGS